MARKTKKNDLKRFEGKWVVIIDNNKVVDFDDNFDNLIQRAQKKSLLNKANIFLVPRKDEGPYILKL